MVMHQFATAGVEHFREAYSFLDMQLGGHATEAVEGPHPRNLHLGGTPIAATVRMVGGLIPDDSPIWAVARCNPDSMEYEIAGVMLWALSLSPRLVEELTRASWWNVPLVRWKEVVRPKLDTIRRAGMFGDYKNDEVYKLRKVINLTYRRDHEADWDKEKHNRTNVAHFKQCVSRLRYTERHLFHARRYIHQTVTRIAARSDSGNAKWWWMRRHHHIPGGSTSAGAWARAALRSDKRFKTGDRPGKKTVAEMLPTDFMDELFDYPPVNAARASTKHEPGDKRRALYASNEVPYLISAFASVHAEKAMREGVVARQSVEDFADWVVFCNRRGVYHLSSDYSDYNSEHTFHDLIMINLIRAEAWLRVSADYKGEKAAAHLWLAAAMCNSWVEYPDEVRRIFSGLYSGSRDTMRDHCDRHKADILVAIDDARELGYSVNLVNDGLWLAGDDEDLAFTELSGAVVYGNMLPMQGHQANPRKQLAGKEHHEFLQVMNHPGSTLQRPLAAIIATMASGNWYVPTATWYDGLIGGISDNAWEAACRGLPVGAATRLACAYLDTAMRVKRGDAYVKLEWWDYRSPNYVHPLWKVQTAAPPVVKEYPRPRPTWPSNATDDWLETVKPLLAGIPDRKVQLYRESLLQSSHGSAFLAWRQDTLAERVTEDWPRRITRRYKAAYALMPLAYTAVEMGVLYQRVGKSSAPRDEQELCARLGVDPQIAQLTGTLNEMAVRLRGRQWGNYQSILPSRALSQRAAASAWAFRSWAARSSSSHPELHRVKTRPAAKVLYYVYAPNGAGKTRFCMRWPAVKDLDNIAAPISAGRPAYREKYMMPSAAEVFLREAIARANDAYSDIIRIMGNYPTVEVERVAGQLGIGFIGVDYIPGWDLCAERLAKRGPKYTPEYIHQLQARYVPYYRTLSNLRELEKFLGL
nr:MAG: putative RNA-dependent RNA polymerase [Trichoderma harzianum dsRNA virus 3]